MAKKIINADTWAQIKGKYVAGKTTIGKIAQVHDISRKSIERKAKKEGWKYGSMSDEVSKAIESATIETIVKDDTDKAVKLTEIFLKDASNIRGITMAIMDAMAKELRKSGGNIPSAEANRLTSCQKVSEIASKTITTLFTNTRKALGMDKDDDVDRARRIKYGETDSSVSNKLQDRIKEKMKANGFDE